MAFELTDAKPGLGNRIAGWLSAWKYVLILLGLLLLSAGINVWQWKRSIEAPLRAEIAGKDQAIEDTRALLGESQEAHRRATAAADQVADRLQGAGARYHDAMRTRPLTKENCAPGQARVDATNQALGSAGAKPPEKKR